MIYSVGFAGFFCSVWLGIFRVVSLVFLWLVFELFFCFKRYCERGRRRKGENACHCG